MSNLRKLYNKWTRVSLIMGQEAQDEETSGKFLNLVVKYVLLFGLEMSIMAPRLLQDLGRLYNQVYVGEWH